MSSAGSAALEALSRFNDSHPWSHNDFYSGWVLRQARRTRGGSETRALDVGCGTGNLVTSLASVFDSVIGVEPDPTTAAHARHNLVMTLNAEVRQEPFDTITGEDFDFVSFVAVLHHLPLIETVRAARSLLRPGGRLVVVGIAREAPDDWPWAIPSLVLNPLIGALKHPRRATEQPSNMTAPTTPATESFADIALVMRRELPGLIIRRRLFWRYTATWSAPPRSVPVPPPVK